MSTFILLYLGKYMQSIVEAINPFTHELVLTVLVTISISVIIWPFRTLRNTWQNTRDKLDAIQGELSRQRTNCLATIQTSNQEQVQLLTKVVETLGDMKTSQAEMSGYLRGMSSIEVHAVVKPKFNTEK